jgi:hypothetical protein
MSTKKTKVFLATIHVAVRAEACDDNEAGACDWFSGLLSENKDVLDWSYQRKGKTWPPPKLVEVKEPYTEGDLFTKKRS